MHNLWIPVARKIQPKGCGWVRIVNQDIADPYKHGDGKDPNNRLNVWTEKDRAMVRTWFPRGNETTQ